MGRAIGGLDASNLARVGSSAGGIGGDTLKAVSTSVNSVAQGIAGLTNAGVGAATSMFEKALPAVQNLPRGTLGGISPLAGLPGPAQFLSGVGDLAGKGIIQKVAEHLQNPALDVSKQLQKVIGGGVAGEASELQSKMQTENQRYNAMMSTVSTAVKQWHEMKKSIITNLRA